MAGSVTRSGQTLPVTSATQGVGTVGSSLTGLDNTEVPYVVLVDETTPSAKVPIALIAQDGFDSNDANAVQASAGLGIRGWLSTLVSLFKAGTAKVTITNTTAAQMVAVNPRLLTTSDTVSIGPATTTGATTYQFRNTAAFAVQTIKSAAGTLYALEVTNTQVTTPIFVSVYDISGTVTPGTSVPVIYAAVGVASATVPTFVSIPIGAPGRAFANAIKVFVSTLDNGTVGAAAGVTVSAAYF